MVYSVPKSGVGLQHRRGQRHQQLHEVAQEQGAVQVQTGTHAVHSSAMVAYGTSGETASSGAEVDIQRYRPAIGVARQKMEYWQLWGWGRTVATHARLVGVGAPNGAIHRAGRRVRLE
jgi:hypothetical protein